MRNLTNSSAGLPTKQRGPTNKHKDFKCLRNKEGDRLINSLLSFKGKLFRVTGPTLAKLYWVVDDLTRRMTRIPSAANHRDLRSEIEEAEIQKDLNGRDI